LGTPPGLAHAGDKTSIERTADANIVFIIIPFNLNAMPI
jgi:hypothetical protein